MLKKAIIIGSACFALAACGPNSTGTGWTIDPQTLATLQAITVAECGFLPTEVQIASLFPSAAPIASQVAVVGDIICKAVLAQPAHRYGGSLAPAVVDVRLPDGTSAQITGVFVKNRSRKH